jgi:hypothetical protein
MPRAKLRRLPDADDVADARFAERMRNATPEEHIESLKRAGILTKSGRFAGVYREFEKLPKSKYAKGNAR